MVVEYLGPTVVVVPLDHALGLGEEKAEAAVPVCFCICAVLAALVR